MRIKLFPSASVNIEAPTPAWLHVQVGFVEYCHAILDGELYAREAVILRGCQVCLKGWRRGRVCLWWIRAGVRGPRCGGSVDAAQDRGAVKDRKEEGEETMTEWGDKEDPRAYARARDRMNTVCRLCRKIVHVKDTYRLERDNVCHTCAKHIAGMHQASEAMRKACERDVTIEEYDGLEDALNDGR